MGVLGAVHAGVAPLFTRGIVLFAYDNIDLRGHVLAQLGASRAARLDNPVAAHTVRLAVDLGCGTGTMTRALTKGLPRARVLAFDTSDEMLGVANALTAERWAPRRASNTRAATRAPPLATGSADVVAISFVLHEAPDHGAAHPRRGAAAARAGRHARRRRHRAFEPSPMMLIGEPYVHGYQQHIDAESARPPNEGGSRSSSLSPSPTARRCGSATRPSAAAEFGSPRAPRPARCRRPGADGRGRGREASPA